MFIIGIDPHKRTHMAVVIGDDEEVIAEQNVTADSGQLAALLRLAAPFPERVWAVEGARGLGALVARQLAGSGEQVVDVPSTLSARVRILDRGRSTKTDTHDARAVAIVARRHKTLRLVTADNDDQAAVLRLLADHQRNLTSHRTRIINRLHALLSALVEGGAPKDLTAETAAGILRRIRPAGAANVERKRLASDLLATVRRLDDELAEHGKRINRAVADTVTTVNNICGIGPIGTAIIVGRTGDINRFPTAGHFARYNGAAPLDASSGPKIRHRLNRQGDRQLNHALYTAAITQLRSSPAGRAYYQRKIEEGHTGKEALRCLKRRISDAVYAALVEDAKRAREDNTGNDKTA